ncbi:MAG: methyltransferase domain-containing protein [Rickettsiales bacterium]|nr:methyltransferase domain-containing protein [Rickettsiales bacterium]
MPKENPYNKIAYETSYLAETNPELLQARAFLFGLNSANAANSRVLEIGCGSGENLIELAKKFPQSKFLGFDEASNAIEKANSNANYLDLKNIEFKNSSIQDFNSTEKFDYIIAHGVFSWIDDDNRNKILKIASENLDDNGVFYVSYNVLPGFNFSEVLRQMMIFHTKGIEVAEEKIIHAKNLLEFINETLKFYPDNIYKKQFSEEFEKLVSQPDWYIFHEFLEKNNKAFYFHEFINLINNFDLQFLSEISIAAMNIENLPKFSYDILANIDDLIRVEQYIDFILNRKFRSSLLCKKAVKLCRNLQNINVEDKSFYAKFELPKALENYDYKPNDKIIFEFQNGVKTEIENFYLISAFEFLAKNSSAEKPISFNQIIEFILSKTTQNPNESELKKMIANNLLRTHFSGGVELVL